MSLTTSDMLFLCQMKTFASHITDDYIHANIVKAIKSMEEGETPCRIPYGNRRTEQIERSNKERFKAGLPPLEPYRDR
ncbi:hypothetical protein P9VFCI_066 [Rhizobium phage P9VFCI]|uniref:Uncharacterized protein n=1 Tax=Rhizobium phage P9VFCI TaxID=2763531 RepID=A0A7G7WXP1_9CAUD|nr:hypothetical protein PP937_gp066 [Rhizobium phage P9VFCI]QNH71985.1 hypothetical protein P9VFCI_066 [Rhizobium phage P9VFCI]